MPTPSLLSTGQPGMMVGKIREHVALSNFVGYLDREATAKKVLHDVFNSGDRYFLSGTVRVTRKRVAKLQ